MELEAERVWELRCLGAKQQAGNSDPAVEPAKAGAVVGEGKAVASNRFREREKAAACQEALIRPVEKPLAGEPRGGTPGALNRGAQCRACRR